MHLDEQTIKIILQVLFTAGGIATLPVILEEIKKLFKAITKAEMPSFLIFLLNVAIAFLAQAIYAKYGVQIDTSDVPANAVATAGGAILFYHKYIKKDDAPTNVQVNQPIVTDANTINGSDVKVGAVPSNKVQYETDNNVELHSIADTEENFDYTSPAV